MAHIPKIYKLVLFGYCITYIHCTVVLATNNYYRRWKRKAPQQIEVLETKKAKLVSVAAAGKISNEIHQLRYHKK